MLQVACLEGLQPLAQALCERALGSAWAHFSLPAAALCSALAVLRRGGGRAQGGLQRLWHWSLKCWPSRKRKALGHMYLLAMHAEVQAAQEAKAWLS